jgi:hypothetical protein
MNQYNATFLHLRRPFVTIRSDSMTGFDKGPTGGLTIAYRKVEPVGYAVGIARCNPTDHYNKHYGRQAALLQLNEAPLFMKLATNETIMELLCVLAGEAFPKNLAAQIRVIGGGK